MRMVSTFGIIKEDTQMGNVTSINDRNKKAENASVQYAKAELQRLLSVHTDMQAKNDQARLNRNVLALINTFAGQNHTSDTARYVVSIFQRLLSLKPLSPIMGTADEWREVTRSSDEVRTFQNKRCPSVFKKCDKMGVMLDCIDQDGLVLSTDGGFTWFTSGKMLKHISFPYMPSEGPEEVFVEEKDDGYIVITNPEKVEALYKDAVERAQAREQILK